MENIGRCLTLEGIYFYLLNHSLGNTKAVDNWPEAEHVSLSIQNTTRGKSLGNQLARHQII